MVPANLLPARRRVERRGAAPPSEQRWPLRYGEPAEASRRQAASARKSRHARGAWSSRPCYRHAASIPFRVQHGRALIGAPRDWPVVADEIVASATGWQAARQMCRQAR
jgi:hypothetical protein